MSSVSQTGKEQRLHVSYVGGRATAAGVAGILEISIFHPFDTVAKRLMSNRGNITRTNFNAFLQSTNRVIFGAREHAGAWQKFLYLYPGSTYAVIYKVLQRTYKLSGQPIVRECLQKNHKERFNRMFGRRDRLMMESTAGSIIGLGEVILLPLDRLKVLSQTNEKALSNGVLRLLRCEGVRGMYAGAVVTMARNTPGSFCLFGGTAFTKEFAFQLDDLQKATLYQNICASSVGACLGITVTNPLDVIKTRVQNRDVSTSLTAMQALRQLLREEGYRALSKGVIPKIAASAPKLVFAYTLTEYLYQKMCSTQATVSKHH
ncbi:putative Mitochondrial carrier protein [Trypanosoma vivax]|uniref:Putative mitochondrial carrier protein n=1 Tax=Trypanosoma vivax (strain Y486) TaxID=1055687 RepID=G0TRS9_TRYVY|nr:putative carrier protein [Trypanosoma vivax]KAH8607494.1 putative Mitochondrial carrier protein [Trypanosoma vivax]CCC46651.1 putative mitochondrial carrier protein [Trypanosoma vivax Y486]